jgi:hypothetical protein
LATTPNSTHSRGFVVFGGSPLELSRFDGMLPPTFPLDGPMMTDEIDKAASRDGQSRQNLLRQDLLKQDRLKSALRENLKRRKVQARERDKVTAPAQGDEAEKTGG